MLLFLISVIFPVLMGLLLLLLPDFQSRKKMAVYTMATLLLTLLFLLLAFSKEEELITVFYLTKELPIIIKLDFVGTLFLSVVSLVWILCVLFAFEYMKKEENSKRFFGFYLMVYGILIALGFAGNLITFYIFYELLTLASFPFVLQNQSKEAIMAGLKYLLYSFFGAYMVLFGLYFIIKYGNTLTFTAGGVLSTELAASNQPLLLLVAFLMILGFSVKAGMFPFHGWLSTAHPIAPAPASAVLSSVIVKAGVLGVIRVVYYIIGPDFIKGTWVQTTWLALTLITVFMGSVLAYREKIFKKRLAYSTVSQVSYILFGLALLDPIAVTGSMLHIVVHALLKATLFLSAGAVIYKTGYTKTDELTGIGKKMPVTLWCFTFASLGLIGIPPISGFLSKWYLATGALHARIPFFSYAGPVILLISALLTAGYLLPISIKGFMPGAEFEDETVEKCEPNKFMLVPLIFLVVLAVILGMFPNALVSFIQNIGMM